jgi:hypothetical protein
MLFRAYATWVDVEPFALAVDLMAVGCASSAWNAGAPRMKLLRFALRHGFTVALVVGAPAVAVAQAALAPPNPQQERCIEAFAETQQEKAIREAIGEPPKKALDEAFNQDKADSLFVWATKRAIAVFGSEEAAYAANEKMRIEKYTRRFELLRKNAKEGHLPSLQLLASHYWGKTVQDIPGLPTPEERSAAYRTLHDHLSVLKIHPRRLMS